MTSTRWCETSERRRRRRPRALWKETKPCWETTRRWRSWSKSFTQTMSVWHTPERPHTQWWVRCGVTDWSGIENIPAPGFRTKINKLINWQDKNKFPALFSWVAQVHTVRFIMAFVLSTSQHRIWRSTQDVGKEKTALIKNAKNLSMIKNVNLLILVQIILIHYILYPCKVRLWLCTDE